MGKLKIQTQCSENGEVLCVGDGGQGVNIRILAAMEGQNELTDIATEITKHYLLNRKDNTPLAFEYDTITQNQVPVIFCYPKEGKNLPLVFLNHGTNGDSVGLLDMGIPLAQEGFFVVMLDARLHGRRRAPNFDELIHVKENYKAAYLKMLRETCADISMLIDYLKEDPRVDSQRIGTTGISQGGYVSFMLITKDKRIKVAAPMIGSPDLEDTYGNSPDFDTLDEALKQEVIQHSPLRNYEKMPPVALLVQNGNNDNVVPVGGVRRLDEKLRPLYMDHPGKYEYIEYDGIAHEILPEMRQRVIQWMISHL